MKRYDCHVGEYFERPDGEFVRYEEVQRLQRALNFWLPSMPDRELPPELEKRLGDDIMLLVGYDGEMEPEAEERGWITLNAEPQSEPHK